MVGISLHVHDVRKIQNSVQEILKKEVLAIPTKARFDNQAFITATEKAHYIAGAIRVIDALENHLILGNILCILYDFREHEYTFTLKLFQSFICYFACKVFDMRKRLFFLLGIILDFEQLHLYHLWMGSDSRMPLQTVS